MPKKEEVQTAPIKPAIPGARDKGTGQWRPDQLDPDLANLALARHLVDGMGTMGHVDKPFIVRQALAEALNHKPPTTELYKRVIQGEEYEVQRIIAPGNPTGYDSSLRCAVYSRVMQSSVHVNGMAFNNVWALLMKPKYIINGMAGNMNQFEEDKGESAIGRLINWFRGGKKNDAPSNGAK
jgi:hypothetical protein